MTKTVSFSVSLLFLLTLCMSAPAQSTATDVAVNQAIMDQANTIVLRQKLGEAKAAADRGDLDDAVKLYEEAYALTQTIGSGIGPETAQTVSGLVAVRMELAKRAQRSGDYLAADTQVARVLKVAPHDADAIAFKKNNDAILTAMKGKTPDTATQQLIPLIKDQKTDAATHVQNGKLLYEAGKFEEAEVQLNQALALDPDNQAAFYYLNLLKQSAYEREEHKRTIGAQDKMVQVVQQWTPKVGIGLPVPNPYATNQDVYTSPGRNEIYRKLNTIRLDNVSWPDGLPLSEVLRYLSDQSKVRDPEKRGINFVFNPNQAPPETATTGAGAGIGNGAGPVQINPNTGQPETAPTAAAEIIDPSTINIKLSLTDVSLQDALNAIVLVADKPIQYSVEDWGIVFSAKSSGPEPPQLEMRVFKVDPNTFYQGLQSVSAFTFGSANNNGSNGSGGSGGSSSSSSSSGGQNGTISGAVVPVIDMAPGGESLRNSGGNGGGGGGGGQQGNNQNLGIPGAGGAAGGAGGASVFANGGVNYLTVPGYMQNVSIAAQAFFKAIGVDLTTPGRSIAFNDRLGLLFVRATSSELDTIERAVQALDQIAPQVHIKARFIEISQNDSTALGFDWYLGQFNIGGGVAGMGGSSPSVPSSSPYYNYFPGTGPDNTILPSATDQLVTSGLRNSAPTIATITGIFTNPQFQLVIHALEQRSGVETLAEPEVVTTSGRQTQMRATDIQYILTGFGFEQGNGGASVSGTTAQ